CATDALGSGLDHW
nr:immunoglobulin heavy chain junction region [Macaca mulatta]MOX92240.1 immunoglobulin heavy chain junction region [Macaca mulatta]MOX92453.1 immunoglobulin heavy chain junction region [Macaca mulatta]MOX92509.1 immunoglobulin heavy chain junction region [Macaca mulatta]MOX92896.1 immunoglobulin heavy chain junction region [Macaca mulatta]